MEDVCMFDRGGLNVADVLESNSIFILLNYLFFERHPKIQKFRSKPKITQTMIEDR